LDDSSVSAPLARLIGVAIERAGGWIPFSRFMALALYAPGLGYYASGRTIVGRMPLFRIELTNAPEVTGGTGSGAGTLRVTGAKLTLTQGAADALNGAFGLDGVFTAGFPIGTARIYARIRDRDG
jgi:hypothetical protein